MKNILFPTDFSEAAENAFIYALKIANRLGATITSLHTYKLPDIRKNMPNTLEEIYRDTELEEFQNYRASLPALRKIAEDNQLGNVRLNHAMEQGEVLATIIRASKKIEADLIVMGTEGASGFKKLFSGSRAGEVMEKAHVPVIAVPKKSVFDQRLDTIAMTTEFKEDDMKGLRQVLAFSKKFDADLYVVYVDTANTHFYTQKMEELKEQFPGHPNLHFHVLKGDEVFGPLNKFLEEKQIDLLAMITHKRNFLQELFNYSKAKQMAYHSDTPIMALPSHILEG
jgi:nucleotide-binding universal stress UspA family protein